MWLKWLPLRLIVRHVARQQGFIDPIDVLAKFQSFAQPSDVVAPQELLREGVVFQARGLMNSQAIQHNLDWVWPYWVTRQFDPRDISFVPRAFSLTQINLTHRNWTAVGVPGVNEFPIVDPRGLVTPFYDGWSIDCWIMDEEKNILVPSRLPLVNQSLITDETWQVVTSSENDGMSLETCAFGSGDVQSSFCEIKVKGMTNRKAWLIVSLRPYNPEGVSFIHDVELFEDRQGWLVNKKHRVYFDQPAQQYEFSYYRHGDVFSRLPSKEDKASVYCKVGMATAAALFKMDPDVDRCITVRVPLCPLNGSKVNQLPITISWDENLQGHCQAGLPDKKFQFLYDAAMRTIILHSPQEVYPGPYTYRRFWFRDAAFIVYAMLCTGLFKLARNVIECFAKRQTPLGYFLSQQGEWDSNGEVLWIIRKYCEMTKEAPGQKVLECVDKGGLWISRKRMPKNPASAHAGLFPAGFSAEHLGPNDYYYWDDFWGVAGLQAAAYLENLYGNKKRADRFRNEAEDFLSCINMSLVHSSRRLESSAMPAAPYRRMDSGAIGSIVAGYPLQIYETHDIRLVATIRYLLNQCTLNDGFFHDMTHSGINPYLTLHMAQVLLRAQDSKYWDLINAVAQLASPTGQWPEAIHPATKGGCMGDGQHVWASAEWVLMIRNCFVREERDRLIVASGIPPLWMRQDKDITFGPAPTIYGPVDLRIKPHPEHPVIEIKGRWFDHPPVIEIALPGFPRHILSQGEDYCQL